MRPFKYSNASETAAAINAVVVNPTARFLGGGTNLVDLMKEDVMRPSELVNVTRLKFSAVEKKENGLSIGGTATNAVTANHELVRENYPLLSMAILAGASAQIRNMATNAGNLNQRTRCTYFYDVNMPCNKREPGSGCGALHGVNKNHAILGWSEKCVATYPSDMAVALAALNAVVHVEGSDSTKRSIPFSDFHRLPGDHPEIDNTLKHGEFITSIDLPANRLAEKSYYLKIRERSSYAFALVSVAAALETSGNRIKDVRIALGGVAHKPWRARIAEQWLTGKEATEANFKAAALAELKNAKPLEQNKYKVGMAAKAIVRALEGAMQGGNYGAMEADLTTTN
ncbi:xanthine dehydrogenase family protein subunit M [Mucilaginibacter achroorhodeus]|uniref:Xanthine dehydrogenase family protein subunit M n=1 Tax=Mucilaginibacter achroorhodeus TaxID=2599294 RepID=A0A563TXX5_9SPHI|nr:MULTISPECIES: xanthine dehydrogenase family protein subunit M [Mucilaginibacter]QXV65962.1 xanthine dehydrogenase family protein subunit M [Mucilaginibacter sp. 21P]TWR24176.1 xanthine dehydrogenase family protein subunit M [Mucilaginibacter achroorhodeus]